MASFSILIGGSVLRFFTHLTVACEWKLLLQEPRQERHPSHWKSCFLLSPLFSCLFLVGILDIYLGILLAPLWPVPSYHLCYMVFVGQFTADTDMCRLADTDMCLYQGKLLWHTAYNTVLSQCEWRFGPPPPQRKMFFRCKTDSCTPGYM